MPKREFSSPRRYIFAFVIGTIIFILGFAATSWISSLEYKRVSQFQQEKAYEIFEDKLIFSFFNNTICTETALSKITTDLAFQGAMIDALEKEFGKNDPNVLFRKKFYTLTELEHFEFLKEMNEKCNFINTNILMFFYSNSDAEKEDSENVGRMLDNFHNKDNVVIYSFDINLDSRIIEALRGKYNITKAPTVLINEEQKIVWPKNIKEIEIYLK